jgi:amino acid adenylation domain-containing protein
MKALAQNEGATLFMLSLAVFQSLLFRYTGQESILVGTPVAGRGDLQIEKLIGFFVNTLVFRADFSEGMSFRELLRQIRSFALDAYMHQEIPFEKLVEELVPQRSLDTTPLFQVMFTFQNIPKQIFRISGLDIEEVEFETGISKFDLSLELYEHEGLHCRFEYNTDLFKKATIRRMMSHFERLVGEAVNAPDQRLAEVPLMSAADQKLISQWNQTGTAYPRELSLPAAFEKKASETPDSLALLFERRKVTYRELNEEANRLANLLVRRGVKPGAKVGVCIERSPGMMSALLGVLKAGAAYVPFDPSYPRERLAAMSEDSQVWGIVSNSRNIATLPSQAVNVVAIDEKREALDAESPRNSSLPVASDQAAYLIYTSGSTGVPRGVLGTHRAAINRFAWMWQRFPFQPGEVCCHKTNLGFVDSVWEIFGPLLAGVPSVIIPQEALLDPEQLLNLLAAHRVTRIVLVPSLLRTLLDHAPNLGERVPELKLWTSSGEVLPLELARRFRAAHPRARLLNLYGSSEVAADVTCYEVENLEGVASVPIGKPISNTQIYVFDKHQQPVPVGVRGEIYVGGEGLALGYWRRPELTAERFVTSKSPEGESIRLYRTGDLGRWRGDGNLEYLGRVDNQVKLRGMRVELGEIEAVLAAHPLVGEAVVALAGEGDQQRLMAYLVASDGQRPGAQELRRYLRTKLPEHMIPASYWLVERLPLLPSGKVNRKALAETAGQLLADDDGVVGPRNEVEAKLAAIWRELLQVEEVGIDQNFFELGGHSLLVLQVIARIRREFEVELAVRSVFEEPTIAGLAQEVEKARALGQKARTPILERRVRSAALSTANPDALLAQLGEMSADDAQRLLLRLLDEKESA